MLNGRLSSHYRRAVYATFIRSHSYRHARIAIDLDWRFDNHLHFAIIKR
jgi:hypothetical protein